MENRKRCIPVSVPVKYDALPTVAIKDETVGAQILCPRCRAVGTLVYLGRWVARGSHWPERGGLRHRQTPLPLCRCCVCKKCVRVLPLELAPFKSYTRMVQESACATYVAATRPNTSLARTVACLGHNHPHRTTLHGWLGGSGARALGRLDRHAVGPPVGALLAESAQRLQPTLLAQWTQWPAVAPCKYRSAQRHDQLAACAQLFATARRLFPHAVYPWLAWEGWLQAHFHVTAWGFPARWRDTAIQHPPPRPVVVGCVPSSRVPRPPRKGKVHDARAPP